MCSMYRDWHRQMHWEHQSNLCSQQKKIVFGKLCKSADGIRLKYKLVGNKKIPVGIHCRSGRKIYASGAIQD